jgi:hypothetical protein
MSASEFNVLVDEVAEEQGREAANTLAPAGKAGQVSTQSQSPSDKQNLTWIDAWNHSYKIRGGFPKRDVLDTKHVMTLYKGNETDDEDRNIYFFWHWTQSEDITPWWSENGRTGFVRNYLNLHQHSLKLTSWSPETSSDVNGEWVNVGATVGVKDIQVGISGEVYIRDGEIGPETSKLDAGGSGGFSITFDGNQDDRTNVNGTSIVRTTQNLDDLDSDEVSFKTRVEANL